MTTKPKEPPMEWTTRYTDDNRIEFTFKLSIELPEINPRGVAVLKTGDGDLLVLGDWKKR